MPYTQTTVTGLDANNVPQQFPVLVGPTGVNVPQHAPSSSLPSFNASNIVVGALTLPASSVDWLQIGAPGSKTIGISRIEVTGRPGAASPGSQFLGLARRTATFTAGGGGSLVDLLAAPSAGVGGLPGFNSGATPSASVQIAQTAAAVSSTTGGMLSVKPLYFPGAAGVPQPTVWEFGTRGQQLLYVSGTSDFIVLTFGIGFATTALNDVICNIEWVEIG